MTTTAQPVRRLTLCQPLGEKGHWFVVGITRPGSNALYAKLPLPANAPVADARVKAEFLAETLGMELVVV